MNDLSILGTYFMLFGYITIHQYILCGICISHWYYKTWLRIYFIGVSTYVVTFCRLPFLAFILQDFNDRGIGIQGFSVGDL